MKSVNLINHSCFISRALLAVLFLAGFINPFSARAGELNSNELAGFQAAAEYSRSQHGVSVLVMRRGEVIFEDYAPGWNAAKPHLLASGTKSFAGLMALCAVQDGLLKLDEPVSDTLTEWKDDPRKSRITIRQLLSLSSGIEGGTTGQVPGYAEAVRVAKTFAEPGEKFSYGPIPFQCFGELMRRKLGKETVENYLHRRILDPIGLKVSFWRKDADGNINLPSGAFLTPREWAKFGELVRLGGKWNNVEIIPQPLLAECFKPSSTNPAYGMAWWLPASGGPGRAAMAEDGGAEVSTPVKGFRPPADTVAAMGKGKNHCYVIPSLDLVVVRMGDSQGREFSVNEFLFRLLGK